MSLQRDLIFKRVHNTYSRSTSEPLQLNKSLLLRTCTIELVPHMHKPDPARRVHAFRRPCERPQEPSCQHACHIRRMRAAGHRPQGPHTHTQPAWAAHALPLASAAESAVPKWLRERARRAHALARADAREAEARGPHRAERRAIPAGGSCAWRWRRWWQSVFESWSQHN